MGTANLYLAVKHMRISFLAALAGSSFLLAACGSGDSSNDPVDNPTTGLMNVDVTDTPVDSAHKVCIVFTGAEINAADSAVENHLIEFDEPVAIEMLSLQGDNSAPLIINEELAAGRKNWIRLHVIAGRDLPTVQDADPLGPDCVTEGSYIVLEDGMVHNLFVPSGDQTGLQLGPGFDIPAGGIASFTIDFDLRKSVGAPPGLSPDYRFSPHLRMTSNIISGTLSGTVAADLATAPDCLPSVYVYSGDAVPDDMDGDDGDPLASALVSSDDNGVTWTYSVGFLPAGNYTAAFTCDDDDPDLDEVLTFEPAGGTAFTLDAGGEATVDF